MVVDMSWTAEKRLTFFDAMKVSFLILFAFWKLWAVSTATLLRTGQSVNMRVTHLPSASGDTVPGLEMDIPPFQLKFQTRNATMMKRYMPFQ